MKLPNVVFSCCLLAPSLALAFGFRLGDQDAFATARGLTVTATPDNASTVFYNPAGLTQVDGLTARMGLYNFYSEPNFASEDGRQNFDTDDNLKQVPNLFVSFSPENSPVSFGFGAYSPFGLSLEWPEEVPFRTHARNGRIEFMAFNPVVAVQLTRTLSLGLGATINSVETALERGLFPMTPDTIGLVGPGDSFKFKGQGISLGFNAGLLWQPAEKHSFGIRYHSSTAVTFSGHARAKLSDKQVETIRKTNRQIRDANRAIRDIKALAPMIGQAGVEATLAAYGLPSEEIDTIRDSFPEEDGDAKLHFPQILTLGYSLRPAPGWNLEANIDWTDWDSLNTVTLHTQHSGEIALPFNYTSSFIYMLGVTRTFQNGLRLSGGFIYSESSIPESQFSPSVPDGDRYVFSCGIGQKAHRFSWDVAYQYSYAPERHINNGTEVDGTYDFSSHAVIVSLGCQF